MGKRRSKGPRILTQDGPTQAVIGVRPGVQVDPSRPARQPMESVNFEAYREQGRKQIEARSEAAIDQARADATALETTARLLRDAPGFPVPHKAETIDALFAMAAGMRLAVGRIPDSRELPF